MRTTRAWLRLPAQWSLLLLATCAAGCFSTTPVESSYPAGGMTIVRTQVFHRSGSSRVPAALTWVRVTWLRRSQSGYAPMTGPDVQGANGNGTFEVRSHDGAVAGIQVDCLTCRLAPTDPALACCLLDAPSCPNCDAVWTSHAEFHFQAGTENNFTIEVACP